MARNQQKKQQDITEIELEQRIEEYDLDENGELRQSSIDLDPDVIDQGAPSDTANQRLGGPTGGDLLGSGKGPAIGETHAADEATADHYGSPEETQAALEGKIASQNTLKLHGHF